MGSGGAGRWGFNAGGPAHGSAVVGSGRHLASAATSGGSMCHHAARCSQASAAAGLSRRLDMVERSTGLLSGEDRFDWCPPGQGGNLRGVRDLRYLPQAQVISI